MRRPDLTTYRPRGQKRYQLQRLGFSSLLVALPILGSCASIPDDAPKVVEKVVFEAPQEDLSSLQYKPTFEPDYNRLTPQPWVEPATKQEQDDVDVYPDRLEFPEAMSAVMTWQPGRVVVAAPSTGTGKNPMGFARRVVSVTKVSPKIVVKTTTMAIEDVIQGDVQVQIRPEDSKPMDLSKVDLEWVANNLYYNEGEAISMPGQPLVDDAPGDETALGFWGFLGKAAKAVGSVVKQVYLAITPATFGGSTSFDATVRASSNRKLFGPQKFSKSITTKKGNGVQLSISGEGSYDGSVEFQQGLQLGAKIALPGHNANSQFWINMDSRLQSRLQLKLELEAAIEAALGLSGPGLQQTLDKASDTTQDILNGARSTFFGNKDVKPASTWKETVYLTKPSVSVFAAGPIPVVVTTTFQVDVECGLEAKASLKADLLFEQNATFKFKAVYDKGTGKTTLEGPRFETRKSFRAQVTGGGEVAASCGLIPRVNVLMYDTVGLFAGIRGSLVARASYESKCKPNPNDYHPSGTVTLGLYGNVGVQIGARLQTPGSSFAGAKGTAAGYDFGPIEPWNTEFPLIEKEWEFSKGLGYCTPLCKNGIKDTDGSDEGDVDCGGACGKCQLGKGCKRNSDCANSVCNTGACSLNKCGDTVTDGLETDIDCGGPVAECAKRCAVGKGCESGADCASGFCGAKSTASANRCVMNHCQDGVQSADESGIDCAGKDCAKCANGVKVKAATDCNSGLWNGVACVGAICDDNIRSGDETGPDCGGPTCSQRCGLKQGCLVNADCSAAAPHCSAAKLCVRSIGGDACQSNADCRSGSCVSNVCTSSQWDKQPSVTTNPLTAMWALDANNIWAAGQNGTMLRWDGRSWSSQANGYPTTFAPTGIWGADVNNVWVTGTNGQIAYWNGAVWTATDIGGTTVQNMAVHGIDKNNVWVAGYSDFLPSQEKSVLKWNGASWTPQLTPAENFRLRSIWVFGPNNIWVGEIGNYFRHWDGTSWTTMGIDTAFIYDIWASSTNNLWAVGTQGAIMKCDGTTWSKLGSSPTTNALISISGSAANNIWAVGSGGTIVRYDGTAWAQVPSGTTVNFSGVAVLSANDAWAVATDGTILRWR